MKKVVIMVSSNVYGNEELLERIYAILSTVGYEVWMSHKGTLPIYPNKSAFENCLYAVEQCDLFLSIISPQYGTGKLDRNDISITHKELRKAIELNKPRWILAHDQVVFSRTLLKNWGYDTREERAKLNLKSKTGEFNNLKVIDMYEEAILNEMNIEDRKDNWVQKYNTKEDAQLFATSQFFRYKEVEIFLKNQLGNLKVIENKLKKGDRK